MSFSIASLHLFFNLLLFEFAFTGALSSSIFLYAQNIATAALSITLLSSPHLSFHKLSYYFYHLQVFYHISYVAFSSFQFSLICFFKTLHSAAIHKALFTQPLYVLPLSFSDTTFLHSTLAISLNFFHPHLIFALLLQRLKYLKIRKSPCSVTFSLTLVLLVKPKSYNWFCLINKLHWWICICI